MGSNPIAVTVKSIVWAIIAHDYVIRPGVLSRYCANFQLLALIAVASDFVPDEALSTAIQVAQNPRTGELLANILKGYTILMQVPQQLASGRVPNVREFIEKVNELYGNINGWAQQAETVESGNPDRDTIEYFTRNVIAEAIDIISDINADYGGDLEDTLQEFYEAQAAPGGSAIGEPGEGSAAELEHLEQGQMEMGRRRTEREKERLQELRKLNPKMFPSVSRTPVSEEERELVEAKKQKEREMLWRKSINVGVEKARRMGIEEPENSEKAFQLAMEHYNQETAQTAWTPEEVELWREAMRFGIRKALGTRQLEKGVNPWQSAVVRNFARQFYTERAGRVVGFRQREQAKERLKRLRMKEERPEEFKSKYKKLEEVKKNIPIEKRREADRERQRKYREQRKKKQVENLPPGYTPPKYVDDKFY